MTDLNSVVTQIKANFTNQRTPTTYSDADYLNFVITGFKRLYNDTGKEGDWSNEFSVDSLSRDLNLLELEYGSKCSEIEVLKNIRNAWNTLVSYTTNALTISNAFKPFEFLTKQINEHENHLIQIFHRMTDVSNSSNISAVSVEPITYNFDS